MNEAIEGRETTTQLIQTLSLVCRVADLARLSTDAGIPPGLWSGQRVFSAANRILVAGRPVGMSA